MSRARPSPPSARPSAPPSGAPGHHHRYQPHRGQLRHVRHHGRRPLRGRLVHFGHRHLAGRPGRGHRRHHCQHPERVQGHQRRRPVHLSTRADVTSVSPRAGLPAGGRAVTITGPTSPGPAPSGSAPRPRPRYTVVSSTSLTATSPADLAGGTVDITVNTPGGTRHQPGRPVHLRMAPAVTAIAPRGLAPGGRHLSDHHGHQFPGAATAVKFGSALAAITCLSRRPRSPPRRRPGRPAPSSHDHHPERDEQRLDRRPVRLCPGADRFRASARWPVRRPGDRGGRHRDRLQLGATAVMFGTTAAATYLVNVAHPRWPSPRRPGLWAWSSHRHDPQRDKRHLAPPTGSPMWRHRPSPPSARRPARWPGAAPSRSPGPATAAYRGEFGTARPPRRGLGHLDHRHVAGQLTGTVDVTVTNAGRAERHVGRRPVQLRAGAGHHRDQPGRPVRRPECTSVTITGTSFAGATAVDFGPTAATITVLSATSITATTPAELAGARSTSP